MKIQRILMPTDFSECAKAAWPYAVFLANQYDAELELVHVVTVQSADPFFDAQAGPFPFPDHAEILRQLLEISRSQLQELLAAGQGERLRIRQHVLQGVAPAPALLDFAEREGVDLIVMGAHGRRGWRRFLLGSVTDELVRLAPCPVLTVRQKNEGSAPLGKFERILVPCDFSEHSAWALEQGRSLATAYGAELDLVHVIETPRGRELAGPDLAVPLPVANPEHVLAALRRFADNVDGPTQPPCHLQVLEGEPASAIARWAEQTHSGLIVLATHGLTGIERFLLGSIAEKLVRLAPCPTLTLKKVVEPADGAADSEEAQEPKAAKDSQAQIT